MNWGYRTSQRFFAGLGAGFLGADFDGFAGCDALPALDAAARAGFPFAGADLETGAFAGVLTGALTGAFAVDLAAVLRGAFAGDLAGVDLAGALAATLLAAGNTGLVVFPPLAATGTGATFFTAGGATGLAGNGAVFALFKGA
jgi:hypothetical protein